MNLEDIARKAGVSRSTVSRVINHEAYVSERTRQRVLQVIEAESFSPNQAAQMLARGRTFVMGVVVPHETGAFFDDPFYFPTLLRGVTEVANQRDYATLLWLGDASLEGTRFYRRVLQNRLMDGLFVSTAPTDGILLDWLLELHIKFVVAERPVHSADRISYVTVDNVGAAIMVTEHFLRLGRRRIAHIVGRRTNIDALDRLAGYRQALARAGCPVDEALIEDGYFTRRGAYEATLRLLPHRPDAIFAAHDQMAVGVLQALHRAGRRVPEDVAVIGFDDLPTATEVSPQLSTVRQPVHEKGAQATRLMLDMIDGSVTEPQHLLLPTELVVRETCGGTSP
jgi:LacI family transcriptional regulator